MKALFSKERLSPDLSSLTEARHLSWCSKPGRGWRKHSRGQALTTADLNSLGRLLHMGSLGILV